MKPDYVKQASDDAREELKQREDRPPPTPQARAWHRWLIEQDEMRRRRGVVPMDEVAP